MATRKFTRWSESEVALFLKLVAEEKIQQELDGPRTEKAYLELSQQMATHGFDRSSQTCREKLKKMKSDYKAIKDHGRRGSLYRSDWKWLGQMEAIYGHRRNSRGRSVEAKQKQEWSVEETGCLIALWSSPESRNNFAGRAKLMMEFIRLEMASAGFNRTTEQINNKLKKLKMEYRDKKKHLKPSDLAQMPFYEMMESVLGNTLPPPLMETVSPASAIPESIIDPSAGIGLSVDDNMITADTAAPSRLCHPPSPSFPVDNAKNDGRTGLSTDDHVIKADSDTPPPPPLYCNTAISATNNGRRGFSTDDHVIKADSNTPPPPPLYCNTAINATNNGRRGLFAEVMSVDSSDDLPPPSAPLPCDSPSPSCSSKESSTTTKRAKRKRPSDGLLEFLERSDERFFQFSRELMHRMEEDTKSLIGLLGRMVTVMEASNKTNNERHPSPSSISATNNGRRGFSTDDHVIKADSNTPPPPPLYCNAAINATNNGRRGLFAEVMSVDSSDDLPPPSAPLPCDSPSPSCSSKESSTTTKRAKRKRPSDGLLEFLERSDERFFQFSRELMHRMEEDTKSLIGLLGRMVTVMEASNKTNNERHPSPS
ncbi:uncharacterized protein LOC109527062 [Hippocampus comes]|uniref:uncharacterized protein LOC109527062 n=1 Tax=Hippocampus comes TaxID=109280 RepID=UPI00094E1D42|nr:PREDICTED: uncharacterized protein LOC109527062 [Hippocampus comes]